MESEGVEIRRSVKGGCCSGNSDLLCAADIVRIEIAGSTEGAPLEVLHLPSLFGIVERHVYRSGYPTPDTFSFIRNLKLKMAINLLNNLPPAYKEFLDAEGIEYKHMALKGNKEHCEEMDRKQVAQAIQLIMDRRNHPLLIHCRSGKHRTGALVGCIRMLQRWSLEQTCNEYVYFCKHKQRYVDKQHIERFDPRTLASLAPEIKYRPQWLFHKSTDLRYHVDYIYDDNQIDEDDERFYSCTSHCSALEAALISGELSVDDVEIGITVSAMVNPSFPDESFLAETQRFGGQAGGGPPITSPMGKTTVNSLSANVASPPQRDEDEILSATAQLSTSSAAALEAFIALPSASALPTLEPDTIRIVSTTVSNAGVSSHMSISKRDVSKSVIDSVLAIIASQQTKSIQQSI